MMEGLGFDKEILQLCAMLGSFTVALLSIMEKLLTFQARMTVAKNAKQGETAGSGQSESTSQADSSTPKFLQKVSYLLLYETGVIVGVGVLLNYLGLSLSRHLQNILFLDMTGTALVAFLLGPWWGAIVALLSNSVVNWLLFPEQGADVVIFPWSLVNMTGAVFWGYMARKASFTKYLRSGRTSAMSHVWFLFTFGVLGAVVMSVPGALIQAALGERAVFALNPVFAETVRQRVDLWGTMVQVQLGTLFGVNWENSPGLIFVYWLQACIRYIPDKTMSAAIALFVLKYGYPLFEKELIHGGPEGNRPGDERILPLVLGLLYAPSCATLLTSEPYMGSAYWPLWVLPWFMIFGGYFALRYFGQAESDLREARIGRAARYARALRPIGREPAHEFCRRLTFATLSASLVFALSLPMLLVDSYRVTFNFFCVVYGILLAVHLVRVAIAQNLSIARANN